MESFKFDFDGKTGTVQNVVVVEWAGMTMHRDNCHGELKNAIDAAEAAAARQEPQS